MKTSIKIAVAALVIASFGFEGCKKGENDPFLSLSSRKARVAGEWNVTAGEGSNSQVFNTITVTETSTYDGATETTVTNPGNSTSTDKYTVSYTFEKDGTFSNVYTDNDANPDEVTTTTGTWNFTGGVGEMKNKSQLLLTILSIANSGGTTTYSGTEAVTLLYDIDQLKGKEMILKSNYTSSNSSQTSTSSLTLTAK